MNIAGQKERGLPLSLLLVVATAVSIVGFMSCSHNNIASYDTPEEYRTKTGKTIIVSETHPAGQSLSTIEIKTKDFAHNYSEIYEDRDPISDVFIADLDANGFDEIYIITTSAGSGSYGTVLGFASNKDKSLSMINFPEMREGDEHFDGYMGHDTFKIEDQRLVRTFPIYNEGDTNQNPTGGTRKLLYGLFPGEAMWQLKIEKSEILDSPQKGGISDDKPFMYEYVAQNLSGSGVHCHYHRLCRPRRAKKTYRRAGDPSGDIGRIFEARGASQQLGAASVASG